MGFGRHVRDRVRARARGAGDGGFTLIEVVVAMVLFAVTASISLGLLVQTTGLTRANVRRTAAANLGQAEIESVRTSKATQITDGTTTTTRQVDGVDYTVTQTAKYVSSSAASLCTGGGSALAYKLVTVKVTWADMGSVPPVRLDTLKAVTIGTNSGDVDTTLGNLAVAVTGANGNPRPGVPVTVTSGGTTFTQTSTDDGCIVFSGIPAGTYTATANVAGQVGIANTQGAAVGSLGVSAGGLTRATLLYDVAASAAVSFDAPPTAVVPTGLPLRVGGTYLTESTLATCPGTVTSACTTGVPGTVRSLFPDNWTVKAGSCNEATPSAAVTDLRAAGATPAVVVPVAALTVKITTAKVNKLLGTDTADPRPVTLTHAAGPGCPSGETYTFTSNGTAAGTVVVLPYGTWYVTTTSIGKNGASTVASPVTAGPGNKSPTVGLEVVA